MKKETVSVQIRKVPQDLHLKIRRLALDSGKSMEQFIIDALVKAVK